MKGWNVGAILPDAYAPGWAIVKARTQGQAVGWALPPLNPLADGSRVVRAGAQYQIDSPDQPWSVSIASGVDRFEVRKGDRWYRDPSTSERCEFANSGSFQPFDTDIWLSFALRVTATTIAAPWSVLGQFRAFDDAADFKGRSPVFSQILFPQDGGTLAVETRADSAKDSISQIPSTRRYTHSNFPLNVWHRFVYRLRFVRTGTNGVIQGWFNGAEVIPETFGAIGCNDDFGPGWKFGLYRGAGNENNTMAVEYANLELGTASLTARVNNPLVLPV